MKKILTILMLFIATAAFSQDPWWQKDSDTFEAQADKLTEHYALNKKFYFRRKSKNS